MAGEYQRALELFEGDEDLARLAHNYRFVLPDSLWEDVLALHENVGAGVQLVFDRLQEANPDTLAGVFGTGQWANKAVLPAERLTAVIYVFTSMQLDPESVTHDLLGAGYEFLLNLHIAARPGPVPAPARRRARERVLPRAGRGVGATRRSRLVRLRLRRHPPARSGLRAHARHLWRRLRRRLAGLGHGLRRVLSRAGGHPRGVGGRLSSA